MQKEDTGGGAYNGTDYLKNLCVMFLVTVGWVIFRIEDIDILVPYLKTMFGLYKPEWVRYHIAYFADKRSIFILIIAFFASYNFKDFIKKRLNRVSRDTIEIYQNIISIILFLLCIISLTNSTYNPFIYFKF